MSRKHTSELSSRQVRRKKMRFDDDFLSQQSSNTSNYYDVLRDENLGAVFQDVSDRIEWGNPRKKKVESSNFVFNLKRWYFKHNITHAALSELLLILNGVKEKNICTHIPDLPITAKTFLKTPTKADILNIDGGKCFYFSWEESLNTALTTLKKDEIPDNIIIDIGIDGIALYEQGNEVRTTWPILAKIRNLPKCPMMVLGSWSGTHKPEKPTFMNKIFSELVQLQSSGYRNGKNIKVKLRLVCMDMQAQVFVLIVAGVTALIACLYCEVSGTSIDHQTVYPPRIGVKRTNEKFRALQYFSSNFQRDNNAISPVVIVPDFDVINQCPIDFMHNACEGVMSRFLVQLYGTSSNRKIALYPPSQKRKATLESKRLQSYIPTEYGRKLRQLDQSGEYKAVEFRSLLLKQGVIIFMDNIIQNHYQHFLLLHAAMVILTDKELYLKYNKCAEQCLLNFVKVADEIYPTKFLMVQNTHRLLHFAEHCKMFGPADSFAAFVFENYMGQFKNLIHSGFKPTEQLHNRLMEERIFIREYADLLRELQENKKDYRFVGKESANGVYYKLEVGNCVFSSEDNDKYFQTEDGNIFSVISFELRQRGIAVRAKQYHRILPIFTLPFDSTKINEFKIFENDHLAVEKIIDVVTIKRKYFGMPKDDFIALFAMTPISFDNIATLDLQ